MKIPAHDMVEGTDAFDRFRKAMKTIVSVRKADVIAPPKLLRKKGSAKRGRR
jgi:hypothetical protein